MDHQSKSFTLEADGILRVLHTECGASIPFDPLSSSKHPAIYKFKALWDTGATGTVISLDCATKLGLKPIGKAKAYHADGESIVNVYVLNLFLPNQVMFPFVKVTEGKLNGTDLLIGMDIISKGDFSVTNFAGKTTFSFRVPSIKKIDFLSEEDPIKTINPRKKIGRNDPCPCNSGQKYKNCHGKTQSKFHK